MSITNIQLVSYAQCQLERPYWYGTFGQTATAALYEQKRKQYPSQYDKWEKSSFTEQYGQRVHDCVGLIKGAVWSNGDPNATPKYNSAQDVSANGIIKICTEMGDIKTIPEVKGLIVWKDNHVGIYKGNGIVIEARGHMWGVVTTLVKERPWEKWGRLPADFVTYVEGPETCTATLPLLKKGMSDEPLQSVKSAQLLLNAAGYTINPDGVFGSKTEAQTKAFQKAHGIGQDGMIGPKTWPALIG